MTLGEVQGSYALRKSLGPRQETIWINFGEDVPMKSRYSNSSAAY